MIPNVAALFTMAELGMTSWLVIVLRATRLAVAPLPLAGKDQREVERMIAEKGDAWLQSACAVAERGVHAQAQMADAVLRMSLSPGLASWQAAAALYARTFETMASAGLQPYSRHTRANFRRLLRA